MRVENALPAQPKGFDTPGEVREFPVGRLELITIGGATVGRGVFEPGWRRATLVQPIVKTGSCEGAACPVPRLGRSPGADGGWNRIRLPARRGFASAPRSRRMDRRG